MSLTKVILNEISQRGVTARVDGETLRLIPREALDNELLARIKEHKPEIVRTLAAIPPMPDGVLLVRWEPKESPVAIETCAIVTDPAMFARTTLAQLRVALAHPRHWVGWNISQLIDRLAQVGVIVVLENENSSGRAMVGRQSQHP